MRALPEFQGTHIGAMVCIKETISMPNSCIRKLIRLLQVELP